MLGAPTTGQMEFSVNKAYVMDYGIRENTPHKAYKLCGEEFKNSNIF